MGKKLRLWEVQTPVRTYLILASTMEVVSEVITKKHGILSPRVIIPIDGPFSEGQILY
jgi:hypothetical protein